MSLAKDAYYSHRTAAALHALVPGGRILYLNQEQTPKSFSGGNLTQEIIDRALQFPQRQSNNRFVWKEAEVVIISGKHTSALGVERMTAPDGAIVPATSLERTLIDISVRPAYADGPRTVLSAFENAAGRLSLDRLIELLSQLAYAYPYHQVIGFYLERAGFDAERLRPLQRIGLPFDFYLAHGMTETKYDNGWRVFYPPEIS